MKPRLYRHADVKINTNSNNFIFIVSGSRSIIIMQVYTHTYHEKMFSQQYTTIFFHTDILEIQPTFIRTVHIGIILTNLFPF